MKKPLYKKTYLFYTCTFLLLLPFVFLPFLRTGKTFVWDIDGIDQHYPILLYYGKLLRGLLAGKGFPMVDFTVGMGFDTITTINYYVLGDPISLLSVFMTAKNAVYIYNFLILFRLYLAGISFILLMKYLKKDGLGVILGALIYVFSGYSLYAGLRHPFFMNPMIYLPLIIIGVEQVLKGKKPFFMIFMVFISLLSNFYFFYTLSIITVIYIIFRYFTVYRTNYKNPFTGLLLTALKTGAYYLLGIAMTSIVFIPVLYAFSQNGRMAVKPGMTSGSILYYKFKYYLDLFQGFYSSGITPGSWTLLSFSAVIIVSMAILLADKKYRKLQMIYLLTLIGLLIPAFGYFMNGFSYTSNRWCFVLSLLTAFIFTLTYEKIFSLEKKEKTILLVEIILYGIIAFIFPSKLIVKVVFFILLLVSVLVFQLQKKWFRDNREISKIIIYAVVFLSLGLNGYGLYSSHFDNYSSEFLSKKEVISRSTKGPLTMIKDIKDNSFYRIETYGDKALNESMPLGFHDVSGYFSLMDGDITSYLKDLEILNQRTAYRFHNMDTRTVMDALASVKYFASINKKAAPYGFQLLKKSVSGSNRHYLFQNTLALPLGYTYENYILRSDYDKLSALEKQNALLNAVILDQDTDYADKSNLNPASGIDKLEVEVSPDADVTIRDGLIDVKKAGAAITLNFNSKPDSETYVRLSNLNISLKENTMTDFYVKAASGVRKKVNVRSPYHNSYFGKENYLINLGYSANGQRKAVISFTEPMTFRYGSIESYSVDMSRYTEQITALAKASLYKITQSNNSIQGDITLDKKGIMVLSIPYSKGWSAYVDGKKENILHANVMYMALPLETGSHHIILRYETPYLRAGFFVSLTAFFIFIIIIIYNRKADKIKIHTYLSERRD